MKLHLVHTNDMHNNFPEKALKKVLRKNSILLDSGDAISGSNTVFKFCEPILGKMGEAGYVAMAMGNREFHYLRSILRLRQKEARFPILCANLVDLRGKLKIQDTWWVSMEGINMALFGLTVPQYPVRSSWEKITGWRFLNPIETAQKTIKNLQEKGAHLIFCLSHLGFEVDQKLAERVKGIHLILGGHSHTVLKDVVWKGETAILQSGSHGRFVGNWELSFEVKEGKMKVQNLSGELVPNGEN
jgi:2',3'-cyclic-nucleotide 2'-phosphodiesterase (5'-nucleotidase family)